MRQDRSDRVLGRLALPPSVVAALLCLVVAGASGDAVAAVLHSPAAAHRAEIRSWSGAIVKAVRDLVRGRERRDEGSRASIRAEWRGRLAPALAVGIAPGLGTPIRVELIDLPPPLRG